MPLIRDGLTWRIMSVEAVKIGMDPWISCGNAQRLPQELRAELTSKGITHINHVSTWNSPRLR